MGKPKLRPPLIPFERWKISALIISYVALNEYVDPRPFSTSTVARILYLLLIVEIVRQWWTYRLEVSKDAVVRSESLKTWWARKRRNVTATNRFRLRRAVYVLIGLYLSGMVIDTFTDRCTGAVQCVLLAPRLLVEQIPTMLQIAFVIALSLFQLGAMFYAMVKVGFVKFVYPGTIQESFDDVWGQDEAKAKMLEQVDLLESDEKIRKTGGYLPKGVLLWGPPGTGKTLLAKAVANASTKPLILVPPGAFAGTFVGTNFLKVYMLFRYVRKLALRYNGVIVFIDEIDSLGHRGGEVEQAVNRIDGPDSHEDASCTAFTVPRGHTDQGEGFPMIVTGAGQMGTLEAFLSAMDGMSEPRGFVNRILVMLGFKPLSPPDYRYMMIGATNRVTSIDPALLRAGRFGRKIRVGYPRHEGRVRTYRGYLSRVSHTLTKSDVAWAARNHHKGTGAEIRDIVNEAVLRNIRTGGDGTISKSDLTRSMMAVRYGESDGTFENVDNVWSVCVHEAGHAVAMHHLMDRVNIWFASVEQRGRTGGMVVPSPKDDDWKLSGPEMEARIIVSLASRITELQHLGYMSNGHGGDGPAATHTAENMVAQGHTFTVDDDGDVHGQLSFSKERDPEAFHDLRESILRSCFKDGWDLLEAHSDEVLGVAELLKEHGTVAGDELVEAIEACAN